MQFFKIHCDPKTNAKLLPDYAIKSVNVREGWQILCDIGHNLNITWSDQNKPYSIWHAETRRFMVNRESFNNFIKMYGYCLIEYTNRFNKSTVFHTRFYSDSTIMVIEQIRLALPPNRTHAQFMNDYLLRGKVKHLKPNEIIRLKDNIEL